MNMTDTDTTQTGYILHGVYAVKQSFELTAATGDYPDEPPVSFRWDWRIAGENRFEVMLTGIVEPSKEIPQRVEVALIAHFESHGEVSINFENFALRNATALLFPYLRENISALTRRGPLQPMELPPLNVLNLTSDFDFWATTGGGQISADPTKAEVFGLRAPETAKDDQQ
jgi:preprotein translocase subunit SecB